MGHILRNGRVGRLAFVIPAHNEERLLGRTLAAIHRAAGALGCPYRIVVADDASTDRTAEVARSGGAEVVPIDRRQIAAARNAAAQRALESNPDVLVFVDADTLVPARTLGAAIAAIESGAVGGGSTIEFDGPVPRWAERMLGLFLFVFGVMRWTGGCFVYCRADAFRRLGGWDERVFAGEEIWFAESLKRLGRFVVLREAVVTSARKLRVYSAREILTTLARVGLRGRRGTLDRSGLDMWYGPRPDEPATAHESAGGSLCDHK